MERPIQRTYCVRLDRLGDVCRDKKVEPDALAGMVDIEVESVIRIMNGKVRPYRKTLQRIADVLAVDFWSLAVPDPGKPRTTVDPLELCDVSMVIPDDWDTKSEAQQLAYLLSLKPHLKSGKKIIVMDAKPTNSTRLTLRMTREDAEALRQAFGEHKLDGLGVLSVGEPRTVGFADEVDGKPKWGEEVEPDPVIPTRRPPRFTASQLLSILSIALSLTGFFPIEAFPLYLLGLVMGVVSVVLRWKQPMGWILPAVGVVLNAVAAVVWPNVIGVFHEQGGYHFRYGERVRYGQVQFIIDAEVPVDEPFTVHMSDKPVFSRPPEEEYRIRFVGRVSPMVTVEAKSYGIWPYTNHGWFFSPSGKFIWPDTYGPNIIHLPMQPEQLQEIHRNRETDRKNKELERRLQQR